MWRIARRGWCVSFAAACRKQALHFGLNQIPALHEPRLDALFHALFRFVEFQRTRDAQFKHGLKLHAQQRPRQLPAHITRRGERRRSDQRRQQATTQTPAHTPRDRRAVFDVHRYSSQLKSQHRTSTATKSTTDNADRISHTYFMSRSFHVQRLTVEEQLLSVVEEVLQIQRPERLFNALDCHHTISPARRLQHRDDAIPRVQ